MRAPTYEEFKAHIWPAWSEKGQTEHECEEAYLWFIRGRRSVRW